MQNHDGKVRRKARKKFWLRLLIVLLVFVFISWFALDRWSKKHGFSGASDFVKTVVVNYWASLDAEYETVEITIDESDFSKLQEQRNQHLKRGIITKVTDRYVPAIISYKGKKIKCKIRLKGHMTDHLQDSKWSFRIKTTGGDAFKEMKIFSLMHPGTRNYIYEWIFHQLLENEGIATVRYSFLNLKINGESWGIYALEEHFAEELLSNRKLPMGPIVGFNPDLYWYSRLNEIEGVKIDQENLNLGAANPQAYDEKELLKSKKSRNDYAEAIIKLNKFKTGELSTSEVFDIDKLAKYHAILDLVGGQFSMDWSDVKYYYNPVTQKIEPVGYESFSVQNTSRLCGEYKFRNGLADDLNLHELIFSDAAFFKLYVKHLKRISKPAYLNDFFDRKDQELKNNLAILYTEFPYKKLPIGQYYKNQRNIVRILDAPLVPVIYLENNSSDTLTLTIGSNSALPIEIESVVYDGKRTKLDKPLYISARENSGQMNFEMFKIPFKKSSDFNDDKLELILVIPGADKLIAREILPLKLTETMNDFVDILAQKPNLTDFEFIRVDELEKKVYFEPGEHLISKNLVIPEGYKVYANSPMTLIINNHARIISKSSFNFSGTEESPITITTSDSTGNGIILLSVPSGNAFKFVDFIDLNLKEKKSSSHEAMIILYECLVQFKNCNFSSNSNDGINVVRGKINVQNSFFSGFQNNALVSDYSKISLDFTKFLNCKNDAVDLNGCTGRFKNLEFEGCRNAISIKNGSSIEANSIVISSADKAVSATDLSKITINGLIVNNVKIGFIAEKKSDVFGPSVIKVSKLKKSKVDKLSEVDKKSKVIIQ